MEDIYCLVCGEPWDIYGLFHGDMTKEEQKRLLAGKGCPSCKGKKERLSEKRKEELSWKNADELVAFLE